MVRYAPVVWVALSVIGLYALRRQNRQGFNLYDPVVTQKERRRRDIRFMAFIVIFVAVTVGSFFAKM